MASTISIPDAVASNAAFALPSDRPGPTSHDMYMPSVASTRPTMHEAAAASTYRWHARPAAMPTTAKMTKHAYLIAINGKPELAEMIDPTVSTARTAMAPKIAILNIDRILTNTYSSPS